MNQEREKHLTTKLNLTEVDKLLFKHTHIDFDTVIYVESVRSIKKFVSDNRILK